VSASSQTAPAAVGDTLTGSGQRIHEILGVTWLVFRLTNAIPYADAHTPFNVYYLVVAIYVLYFLLTRPQLVGRLAIRPIFLLWLLTALIPLLLYVTSSGSNYAYMSMRTRVVCFSVIAGSGVILLAPKGAVIAQRSALLALAIIIPMNFFELVIPNIWSNSPGRAAGFFVNPNISGAAIIVSTLLAVDFSRHTKQGLFVMAFSLAGIITTFSRSAMLFGGLMSFAYIMLPQGRDSMPAPTRIAILAGGSLALALGIVILLNFGSLDEQASGRLLSVVRADYVDASTTDRLDAARYGFARFMEHFWTGRGLGSPEFYDVETHNSFLHIAYEYGIMGLVLYCTILLAGMLKIVQFGWRSAINLSLLASYLLYYSVFDHYVHAYPAFAIGFAVLMTDALLIREPPADQPTMGQEPHDLRN
jgi:O-antigen ligase